MQGYDLFGKLLENASVIKFRNLGQAIKFINCKN